jgi:hypothetical protein
MGLTSVLIEGIGSQPGSQWLVAMIGR